MKKSHLALVVAFLVCRSLVCQGSGESLGRNEKIVRNMLQRDKFADFWIYGDLRAGFAKAKRTGKPLLVSYRCVP